MSEGRLYICATPIGNLGDVTDRLRTILTGVDLVYAEDTRRAAKLLSHVGADVPVRSMFVGNEKTRSGEIIEKLQTGLDVAVISDAGTPSVSDPGAWVAGRAHSVGIPVTVIPGPSAVTAALAVSGFPADRFVFEGFLPRKGKERERRLANLATDDRTTVLFASPRRLSGDLVDLASVIEAQRPVAITRELTKMFEEVWVGPLGDAVEHWSGETKGEVTLVISPAPDPDSPVEQGTALARQLVAAGSSLSDAARQAAGEVGAPRREIYQTLLDDVADQP